MCSKTLDREEIKLFNSLAIDWWNEEGKMSVLHAMSEARMSYIRKNIIDHFEIRPNLIEAFKGLKILDVGCGGGISSEPLARMGGKITGIDHSKELIKVAKNHSEEMGLKIKYLNLDIKEIAESKEKFDVVVALELLEHVKDFAAFCEYLSKCIKPEGMIILSTINRNFLSNFVVINLAEKILKKLPKGTHDYKKFIKPAELEIVYKKLGYGIKNIKGLSFLPLNRWVVTNNTNINYICAFIKN